MKYSAPGSADISAVTGTTGAIVPSLDSTSTTAAGVTLASGTTYFFPFGAADAPTPTETPTVSVQIKWDAAIIATVTLETCNFPRQRGGVRAQGIFDVSDFDVTPGNWLQQNPTTAYVPVVGGSVTANTVSVPGGSAGGADFELGGLGARRGRLRVVVAATGGIVRVNANGKAGG